MTTRARIRPSRVTKSAKTRRVRARTQGGEAVSGIPLFMRTALRGLRMNRLLNVFLQAFKIRLYLRVIFQYVIAYVEDLFDPGMFQCLIPI
jgi:hypothetical protein